VITTFFPQAKRRKPLSHASGEAAGAGAGAVPGRGSARSARRRGPGAAARLLRSVLRFLFVLLAAFRADVGVGFEVGGGAEDRGEARAEPVGVADAGGALGVAVGLEEDREPLEEALVLLLVLPVAGGDGGGVQPGVLVGAARAGGGRGG